MYSRLSLTRTATGLLTRRLASSSSERVVVLGSGWAGFQTVRPKQQLAVPMKGFQFGGSVTSCFTALNMDKSIPLTVVSPNNHFVFTPLLASASVGTLEGRVIQEPIRSVLGPKGQFLHAKARSLLPDQKKIVCEASNHQQFELSYDKLVIAVGVKTNTFGIESISKAAKDEQDCVFFLKQLQHARAIRDRIIDVFEMASLPTVSEEEKRRLLTFLVVGGGPTSCEFTAELHDFVKQDVKRLYKSLLPYVKITIVEAGPALLGPFDKVLQDYALRLFHRRDIDVRLGTAVIDIEEYQGENAFVFSPAKRALLSDGSTFPFGTMVWSAGLAPRAFTANLDPKIFPLHKRTKRLLVDDYLRVIGHEGSIWAIGDAAVNQTGVPLPQLAQVARQEGIYMADVLSGRQKEDERPFKFFSMGSMAFLGELKGIYDGSSAGPLRDKQQPSSNWMPPALRGLSAFFLWRFAYWGRQTSITNKLLIPMYWFKAFLFGRDTSRY